MPHQLTLRFSNESLQSTQHIAVNEPHASSSNNSMQQVEPMVADRQHAMSLTDGELPENATAGFKQTSSRTKPVVRHPPNFLILPLRPLVQLVRAAVGVRYHRPDGVIDSTVAPYLPSISSAFPPSQPPTHSQLPIASPHVGPHQPKATLQLPTAVSQCPTTNQSQTDPQSTVLTGGVLRQTGNLEDVRGTSRSSQPTVSLSESVPSPPMPLHRDIPDNLPTCLDFNHISTPRVVTSSPTLIHTKINRGAEAPGDSTSPTASTLLSPVPSHSCGSSPKHLHGLNSNYDYGPASSPADTSPMLWSNPEMPPRFRLVRPQPTMSLTTPQAPPETPMADTPVIFNFLPLRAKSNRTL